MNFCELNNSFRKLYFEYLDAEIAFKVLASNYDLSEFCYILYPKINWNIYIDSTASSLISNDVVILSAAYEKNFHSAEDILNIVEQIVVDSICNGIDPYNSYRNVKSAFELQSIHFNINSKDISPSLCYIDDYFFTYDVPNFSII